MTGHVLPSGATVYWRFTTMAPACTMQPLWGVDLATSFASSLGARGPLLLLCESA